MPGCWEGERTDLCFLCLCHSIFPERRAVFRVISTVCGGAIDGYTLAGREGRHDAPFSFVLPPLNFHGVSGRGGAGSGGSLPSADALLACACQRLGRASGLNFVFVLASFNFPGPGDCVFGGSPHSAAALSVDTCQWDGRGGAMHRFRLRFRR